MILFIFKTTHFLVKVLPKKGRAVFWHNLNQAGEVSFDTQHEVSSFDWQQICRKQVAVRVWPRVSTAVSVSLRTMTEAETQRKTENI